MLQLIFWPLAIAGGLAGYFLSFPGVILLTILLYVVIRPLLNMTIKGQSDVFSLGAFLILPFWLGMWILAIIVRLAEGTTGLVGGGIDFSSWANFLLR